MKRRHSGSAYEIFRATVAAALLAAAPGAALADCISPAGSGGFKVYASDDGSAWSVLVPSVPYGDAAVEMGMAYGNGVFVTTQDGTEIMRASCVE